MLKRLLPIILALSLGGCGEEAAPERPAPTAGDYIETGDLEALQGHRVLRILLTPQSGPKSEELALAEAFARSLGLEARPIQVNAFDELIPALLEGRGDLIAANLTVTSQRRKQLAFASPIAYIREQLVARADDPISELAQLKGRRIAVREGTTHFKTISNLKRLYPHMEVEPLSSQMPPEAAIEALAAGTIDLTVADSNQLGPLLEQRDDIRVALDLGRIHAVAWGMRPDASALLDAANRWLSERQLALDERERYTGDLDSIKKRGVLRVLTRNNAATYFLWRGEMLGFDYELVKRFADSQGLRLEVVEPPDHRSLIPWLLEGHGDLIAAAMTITPERGELVAFTRPYHRISQVVVSRADDPLSSLEELAGRSITIRRSSSYWNTLEALRDQYDFELLEASEEVETETLIRSVAAGEIDLTVADSHILDIEMTWESGLRAAVTINGEAEHGWAVRQGEKKLLAALDAFLDKEYRGLFYNVTYQKYFQDLKRIRDTQAERIDRADGRLSPYDDLVRKYAGRFGFDWRLIVSQMFQESRFDPNARSWVGALGLMQVMPRTGQSLGLGNLRDPETGIHAGVAYLEKLMKKFETDLPAGERTWFALASYNAGRGHVQDARKLASRKGWDPNRWFDHVERAMLLLSQKRYARQARYGYVRGEEPVAYVREIRDRYMAYLAMEQRAALTDRR